MSVSSLVDYYTRRASEYERIYHKPERQKALSSLAEQLRSLLEKGLVRSYWPDPDTELAYEPTSFGAIAGDVMPEWIKTNGAFYEPDAQALDAAAAYCQLPLRQQWG
ncbi:MAG: hypothetical protein V4710_06945, partial [Verrucomicrobiota bacterium]